MSTSAAAFLAPPAPRPPALPLPPRRAVRGDAGFTLLEVLVALVVLGFLVAGLYGGVRLGMRAWDAQARAVAGTGELDAADRALRRLIERIEPGDSTRAAGLEGSADRLLLLTELPAASTAARRAEALLAVDGDGRLVLRWVPRRPGVPDGPPPPAQEVELLRGVARLQLAYWSRGGADGEAAGWVSAWDRADPPPLVRVRLQFRDGRHWPDIIAAPARERYGS